MNAKKQQPKGIGPPQLGSKKKSGPGSKPSALQMEQRITEVEMLLSLGSRRTQIHAAMEAKYNIDWRTTDRYMSRARANLVKRSQKPKEEHCLDSFNFYQAIALNSAARPSDRITARKRIDELFGLDAPRRTEISGPEGSPIAFGDVKVYVPEKRSLVAIGNGEVESRGNGKGDDTGQNGD